MEDDLIFADDDSLHVAAGVRFQRDQLTTNSAQIAAVVLAGNAPDGNLEASLTQNAVSIARSTRQLQNIDDLGVYGQLAYTLPPAHNVTAGVRHGRTLGGPIALQVPRLARRALDGADHVQ